jgi:hypothetical protein
LVASTNSGWSGAADSESQRSRYAGWPSYVGRSGSRSTRAQSLKVLAKADDGTLKSAHSSGRAGASVSDDDLPSVARDLPIDALVVVHPPRSQKPGRRVEIRYQFAGTAFGPSDVVEFACRAGLEDLDVDDP